MERVGQEDYETFRQEPLQIIKKSTSDGNLKKFDGTSFPLKVCLILISKDLWCHVMASVFDFGQSFRNSGFRFFRIKTRELPPGFSIHI